MSVLVRELISVYIFDQIEPSKSAALLLQADGWGAIRVGRVRGSNVQKERQKEVV